MQLKPESPPDQTSILKFRYYNTPIPLKKLDFAFQLLNQSPARTTAPPPAPEPGAPPPKPKGAGTATPGNSRVWRLCRRCCYFYNFGIEIGGNWENLMHKIPKSGYCFPKTVHPILKKFFSIIKARFSFSLSLLENEGQILLLLWNGPRPCGQVGKEYAFNKNMYKRVTSTTTTGTATSTIVWEYDYDSTSRATLSD